jgi:RimJ/RimL family protein N-acetyltransferase
MDDAAALYMWRTDPATQAASCRSDPIDFGAHVEWLRDQLASNDCRIFVGLRDGNAVGTVRASRDRDGWILSWTVAPANRGTGIGSAMVQQLLAELGRPLRAQVKKNNLASIRIAESAGMRLREEANGILHYELS